MTDPLSRGPLVFRPRAQYRNAQRFMVAFVLAFLRLGLSFPFMGRERGRSFFLFVALVGTVCFGGLLGLVVLALRETCEPIRLDAEGLAANGRRLGWGEIAGAEEVTRPDRMVVVRPIAGVPLRLRTTAYEDGPELGRIVLARAARPVDVPPDEERIYRPQGLGQSAFALGLFLWGTPKPPHARLHPAMLQIGLLVPLAAWLAVYSLTWYIRLGPRELTVGSALGRRTIALALVDDVETTEAGLRVRAGGQSVVVAKGLAGFPELRARLLALAPKGVPVVSEAAPVVASEARVFAPKPSAWAGSGS